MAKSALEKALGRKTAQEPRTEALSWWIEAQLLRLFWGISRLLPVACASALGAAVFGLIGPRLRKTRQVRRNLAVMIGTDDPERTRRLERDIWRNFGSVMAEYPHVKIIVTSRMRIELAPEVAAFHAAGRPAIYFAAHLGNWELCAAWFAAQGYPLKAVYSPQANPLTDAILQGLRISYGCGFVTKKAGLRELMQALTGGSSVGLVMDQRVDNGAMVPFFGRPAATATVPARLALKLAVPLVPVEIERLPGARFILRAHSPLQPADPTASAEDQAYDLTAQINAQFEAWIRKDMGKWHCLKRRWPKIRETAAKTPG